MLPIGLAQIRIYEDLLKERKRVFDTYGEAFKQYDWAILPPSKQGEKKLHITYMLYVLKILLKHNEMQ